MMARRLLVLYLLIAFGPLLAFAAAFAARDLLARRPAHPHGNGHTELEGLAHTAAERQAVALLSERLEAHGFQVERNACGLETAFRATWGEGPVTIAYLCEYDALPEIGHACGHNLIATAGLGAAHGPNT